MDTIVFDIETQNFFTDPGVGWNNFGALKISVVCAYSYARGEYLTFEENEMREAADFFAKARRLVGFSMNRYDIPVLTNYFRNILGAKAPDLWAMERVDLLEEVEMATRKRISLSRLAEANLGVKKEKSGREAGALYRKGRMDELKEYCLKDVELTKGLYELYEKQNYFMIPDRETGEVVKIDFAKPASLAL